MRGVTHGTTAGVGPDGVKGTAHNEGMVSDLRNHLPVSNIVQDSDALCWWEMGRL